MTRSSIAKTFLTLVFSLGICLLAGYIGGYPGLSKAPAGMVIDLRLENYLGYFNLINAQGMASWYTGITKPIFSPPFWSFSPAWMLSFLIMGFTLFLILEAGTKQREVMLGLLLFGAQLLFLLAWAYNFFGTHAIFFAFLFMVALFATLLCAVIQIFRFSVTGGMLMIPYLIWVLWLAWLNYGVMTLNKINFGF